jgi:hypothetical protein
VTLVETLLPLPPVPSLGCDITRGFKLGQHGGFFVDAPGGVLRFLGEALVMTMLPSDGCGRSAYGTVTW